MLERGENGTPVEPLLQPGRLDVPSLAGRYASRAARCSIRCGVVRFRLAGQGQIYIVPVAARCAAVTAARLAQTAVGKDGV